MKTRQQKINQVLRIIEYRDFDTARCQSLLDYLFDDLRVSYSDSVEDATSDYFQEDFLSESDKNSAFDDAFIDDICGRFFYDVDILSDRLETMTLIAKDKCESSVRKFEQAEKAVMDCLDNCQFEYTISRSESTVTIYFTVETESDEIIIRLSDHPHKSGRLPADISIVIGSDMDFMDKWNAGLSTGQTLSLDEGIKEIKELV